MVRGREERGKEGRGERGGGREGGGVKLTLKGKRSYSSHSDHFSHESYSFFWTRVIPMMCNVCGVHIHVRDCTGIIIIILCVWWWLHGWHG